MGTAAFGRALAKRVLGAFGVKNTAYTNTIDIGGTSSPTDNKATWAYGFPSKTMMPVDTTNPSQGGIPPNGKDMNGVLNSISAECENSMNGILPNEWIAPNVWTSVDSSWKGYPQGAVVLYPTGATASRKKLYQSTANNNLDTPSSSSKWIALEREPNITIYPSSRQINGNINCWVRESADGFIMQGGTCVSPVSASTAVYNVGLIKSYAKIQMGASATSVSQVTRTGDNDPAMEVQWFVASLKNPTSTGLDGSIAYLPMPLSFASFRVCRVSGSGSDPTTIIWTSWGF